MKKIALLVLLTLSAHSAFATDRARQLTLTFQSQALEISGMTPGGTVYVYSLAREPRAWNTSIVSREIRLTDDDKDGAVIWDFEKSFPRRSVWFAVELQSGKYGASASSTYPAQRIALTGSHLSRDSSGGIEQVSYDGSLIQCIVVRPADGNVWGATVAAGDSHDRSIEKGKVTLRMSDLTPRDETSATPPEALDSGDVLFVINSFKAQYSVTGGEN